MIVEYDKRLHFEAGFIIASVVGLLISPAIGVLAGAMAGVGKEVYDEWDYNGADLPDLLYTIGGTFLGAIIADLA